MTHLWKEFAKMINAPYRKKFITNGYGTYRIDNKGLYNYDSKEYDDGEYTKWFLGGEAVVI